jgi:septum formation protein
LVLGCDTVVEVDGVVLGKPKDADDLAYMWRLISGTTCAVITGQVLIDRRTERRARRVVEARLTFAAPTKEELAYYSLLEQPYLSAGGFRLEGIAAAFVRQVSGEPSTVSGLSVHSLREMMSELGHPIHQLWVEP